MKNAAPLQHITSAPQAQTPVSQASSGFVDNRTQASTLRNEQQMAGQSAHVRQLKQYSQSMGEQTQRKIASVAPVMQLASIVKYEAAPILYDNGSKSETVGRSMTAFLDPRFPINGSAPGAGEQQGLMEYLRDTKRFKSMKRGHLMNGQLGGPGIASNLFPITAKANSDHKFYAENKIKEAISDGVGVMYQVSVNSESNVDGMLNGAAEFRCSATAWDAKSDSLDLVQDEPFAEFKVTSFPEADTNGGGGIDVIAERTNFKTADLPHGWGEKGKGLTNWDDEIPPHYIPK